MAQIIYLVRHADALEAAHDATRQLSPRGREQMRHMAALLRPAGAFNPAEAWHSPLVRARETAELLTTELRLKPVFREVKELEPEANPATAAALLAKARAPVALFGHEPHLSTLATLLVTGEPGPAAFVFKKATVLALEPAGAHWCVRWQLSPDLFER